MLNNGEVLGDLGRVYALKSNQNPRLWLGHSDASCKVRSVIHVAPDNSSRSSLITLPEAWSLIFSLLFLPSTLIRNPVLEFDKNLQSRAELLRHRFPLISIPSHPVHPSRSCSHKCPGRHLRLLHLSSSTMTRSFQVLIFRGGIAQRERADVGGEDLLDGGRVEYEACFTHFETMVRDGSVVVVMILRKQNQRCRIWEPKPECGVFIHMLWSG